MFERLCHFQFSKPWFVIFIAVILAALSLPLILQLGIKSNWEALLPADKPSVKDLELTKGRLGGLSTLTLAFQSQDTQALKKIASDIGPQLEKLKHPSVFKADWNNREYQNFLEENKFLYAKLEDLEEIFEVLQERSDFERNKHNPFFVQLENEPPPSPKSVLEKMRDKKDKQKKKITKDPDGFFVHPDGGLLLIFVRTDLSGGDTAGLQSLIDEIQSLTDLSDMKTVADDMTLEFHGPLVHSREETIAIKNELLVVTTMTIVLVLICIFLFFRSWRSIPVLGISLFVPVFISFAFAEVTVDYLNTSTAFLGSIIIGNGINPNIIWLARYFEERRTEVAVRTALQTTHQKTWLATLTASLAASIAYASLMVTDFRGFRDFGMIGGFGMIACWLSAIFLLPCLVVVSERFRPLKLTQKSESHLWTGIIFTWTKRFKNSILVTSILLGIVSCVICGTAILSDPIEYDFRKLRSTREKSKNIVSLSNKIVETSSKTSSGHGIAILTDTQKHANDFQAALIDQKNNNKAPFDSVRSIQDLLPTRQNKKIDLLGQIRELMLELRPKVSEEDRNLIDENLPPQQLSALQENNLPEKIARPFSERDGTRGRILYVESDKNRSTWDGRYLIEWTQALRNTKLKDNYQPPLAGRAPVFADIVEAIWKDGPLAISVSFLATLLLLLISFRQRLAKFATLGSLLLGIVWMGATMAIFGMKLNFLNFVAFPITFGNGVDYSVNVMRRFLEERKKNSLLESVRSSITSSGGAVALCSLTTIIGYCSLLLSQNQAINSFGAAMVISEITCLLVAIITLPSFLLWYHQRKKN